jgi:hypothetical protein
VEVIPPATEPYLKLILQPNGLMRNMTRHPPNRQAILLLEGTTAARINNIINLPLSEERADKVITTKEAMIATIGTIIATKVATKVSRTSRGNRHKVILLILIKPPNRMRQYLQVTIHSFIIKT